MSLCHPVDILSKNECAALLSSSGEKDLKSASFGQIGQLQRTTDIAAGWSLICLPISSSEGFSAKCLLVLSSQRRGDEGRISLSGDEYSGGGNSYVAVVLVCSPSRTLS